MSYKEEIPNCTYDLTSSVGTIIEHVGDLYNTKHEIPIDPATKPYPIKGIARVVSVKITHIGKHHLLIHIKSQKHPKKKYNLKVI